MTESSRLFSETFGAGAAVARENLVLMFGEQADDIIHNQPDVWIRALHRPGHTEIGDAIFNIKLPAKNRRLLRDVALANLDDIVRIFRCWKNPSQERMEDIIRAFCRPLVKGHLAAKKAKQEARTEAWRNSKAGQEALSRGKLV